MKIDSLEHAVAVLNKYVPKVAKYTGDGMTLDRMWPLLKAVGNPHEKFKAIHIAGTSGKTSTAYYIATRLAQSGKNVGLTVSPHVDSITERVQINGSPISEELFCSELGDFLSLISDVDIEPSYFELLVVFVFWFFERSGVDYAVIETGLGGLLDGTNVLRREDKVCVITDIGYDHMNILGNTIEAIAAQKAGIIHQKNHVFTYEQSEKIMQQIKLRVDKMSAELHVFDYDNLLKNSTTVSNLPEFQKRNWLIADEVSQAIAKRDGFRINADPRPENIVVPGRMDTVIQRDGTTLIMDGAHNGQKMEAFVVSFREKYPNKKSTILLALKQGKEYISVIDALLPITNRVILTSFNTLQDMPAISQDTKSIEDYCIAKSLDVKVIDDNREATDYLLSQKAELKIITGSFYLLGQVRQWLFR